MTVREQDRVDANGCDQGPLPRQLNGGEHRVETRPLPVTSEGGGADGGDSGEERESVAGEEEQGLNAEESDGIAAGFFPHVAGLETRGS